MIGPVTSPRLFGLFAALAVAGSAAARETRPIPDYARKPGILAEVGFDQKPGAQVPLDATFKDEAGRTVVLGDYFGERPVILNLVYYDCPLLCNQVLDSLVRSLNILKPKVGRDFDVLSVSIDPREDSQKALAKESEILRRYTVEGAEPREGWHFLTGDEATIRRLADSVGFRFSYNANLRQYAHPAGIIFLTPAGQVSRYIYGLSFPARDMNLALAETSAGKVGGIIQQALLLCYAYDPASGSYSFAIMMVLRALGSLTVLVLFTYLFRMLRRDRRTHSTGVAKVVTGPPPPVALN